MINVAYARCICLECAEENPQWGDEWLAIQHTIPGYDEAARRAYWAQHEVPCIVLDPHDKAVAYCQRHLLAALADAPPDKPGRIIVGSGVMMADPGRPDRFAVIVYDIKKDAFIILRDAKLEGVHQDEHDDQDPAADLEGAADVSQRAAAPLQAEPPGSTAQAAPPADAGGTA